MNWIKVTKTYWTREDRRGEVIYDPEGFWCWATYAGGNRLDGSWERGRWLETAEAAMAAADIMLGDKRGAQPV